MPVLARMEARGIKVDRQILSRLSGEFAQKLGGARSTRSTSSPARASTSARRSSSATSCSASSACPAARRPRPAPGRPAPTCSRNSPPPATTLAARILDWRQLSKLKSTYTDLLPGYIHPETGRVHTSYALASTTTGRLSSSDPNLQNIPIRTEEGRAHPHRLHRRDGHEADLGRLQPDRAAHPRPHRRHPAAEAGLRRRPRHPRHDRVARCSACRSRACRREVRRRAKAINFGIIYGISAFGLANQLGIPREEAGAYIKTLFRALPRHPRLHGRDAGRRCASDGYVTTLFGRKIHFPQVKSDEPGRARLRRARRDQRADPGHRRRHHPPRHDPHGGRARQGEARRRGCCCRSTTSWSSRRRRSEVEATMPVIARVMEKARRAGGAAVGAAAGRRPRRRQLGRGALSSAGITRIIPD